VRDWVASQLEEITSPLVFRAVILDPLGVVVPGDIDGLGDVEWTDDWMQLRRVWERAGRNRQLGDRRLVIVSRVTGWTRPRNLPFDIETASTVVVVTAPIPTRYEYLLRDLEPTVVDRLVKGVRGTGKSVIEMALEALGVPPANAESSAERQIRTALRLALRTDLPQRLKSAVAEQITDPIAKGLLNDPMQTGRLQEVWEEYLNGDPTSRTGSLIEAIGEDLAPAFSSGLLRPTVGEQEGLPSWARVGVRQSSAIDRLAALLVRQPDVDESTDLAGWADAAEAVEHAQQDSFRLP